jgi:hypothetical protein
MRPEPDDLPALEASLWRSDSRFDRGLMEATFAPDFFEFGRSGRRYAREQVLPDPAERQEIDAKLHGLALHQLSSDLVLVTYRSEVRYPDGTEWANRSSVWDRTTGHWQIRFHQGTSIPEVSAP